MDSTFEIRGERLEDHLRVKDVVKCAYADVPYSDHREHLMIHQLRGTDAYLPALSLLAEMDGEAVGHILLTKCWIRNDHSVVTALALAPLSSVTVLRVLRGFCAVRVLC